MVGHAGARLPADLTDVTGLTAALRSLRPRGTGHDPGRVLDSLPSCHAQTPSTSPSRSLRTQARASCPLPLPCGHDEGMPSTPSAPHPRRAVSRTRPLRISRRTGRSSDGVRRSRWTSCTARARELWSRRAALVVGNLRWSSRS
ncbi:hypothetical protein B7767_22765 [Streptomyces sp. 13-12-16]|nr:hypothetical protein B7767_22765 [Streptomyces sp. 13-12-16]